jgi:hypothetical protein
VPSKAKVFVGQTMSPTGGPSAVATAAVQIPLLITPRFNG